MTTRLNLDPQFIEQVVQFVVAHEDTLFGKSEWIECSQMKVFIRIGKQYFDADGVVDYYKCITIANVVVAPDHRKAGLYSQLLELCEQLAPVCYIENVLEPSHISLYLRRGYRLIPQAVDRYGSPHLYKVCK